MTMLKAQYKKITPPFGYFGSKNQLALKLCSQLPPHNCWVEAFCGSAALTLAKAPTQIEVINDINDEIVNLFRQLRCNSKQLTNLIKLTPYAEKEFIDARNEDLTNLSDLEKARIFLVKSMMAINGVFGKERGGYSYSDSYSRNGHEARVNRWNNLPERLEAVVSRLKNVRVEKKDARRLLQRFSNRPATLVYLDPPYLFKRTNGYDHDVNDLNFHREMLDIALKANCMIFISGYENEFYNSVLTEEIGWKKSCIETSTRDSKGQTHPRTEVVWMNRFYTEASLSNQVPIQLSEVEKKHGKINPIR